MWEKLEVPPFNYKLYSIRYLHPTSFSIIIAYHYRMQILDLISSKL